MIRASELVTVFVDADNTLWDTDRVFASTQLRLLHDVEESLGLTWPDEDRLQFVRAADQELASLHHDGLRYPPALLVRALSLALDGMDPVRAAKIALHGSEPAKIYADQEGVILNRYFQSLKALPQLKKGVADGLRQMKELNWNILMVTESAVTRARETADALSISQFFDRVLEGRKRPELYQRILKLVGSPSNAYMIGDQIDRDIAPAKQAGLKTIYFPGGFKPRWHDEEASPPPDFVISDFREAVQIIRLEHAC
ncbi:HAD family hydrolase [uncultured Croceicoccus sp.]|uniref:HAD family hydrolase n=1 Tax=Qipengyuania sp. 902 TaxID=3417565 RepID=UPI000C436E4C|nr:HAD family hydrolase [uncultured Croceicoccus sp.]MAT33752.1 hypothetical protein [Ponticaulis sp.]